MIEACGAKLIFLPPYSPDLNPIEMAWSWLKRWLKSARARTEDSINIALAMAMDIVDAAMASAWIRHCGFLAQCR
jgi:transposase